MGSLARPGDHQVGPEFPTVPGGHPEQSFCRDRVALMGYPTSKGSGSAFRSSGLDEAVSLLDPGREAPHGGN